MATHKFFKSLLFTFAIAIGLFSFSAENSFAYPVFAQQGYSNPRAANGKLACANCHLNQKAIEIEAPQGVLPNSVFEVEIKVPYDITRQQLGADGKPADLNVGGILILPKGFKLASKNQISASEFFDSYKVSSDYIDDDISQWKLGAFKVCQFSPDFDFLTKRIGKDFLTFKLSHSGSGYSQITDLPISTSINTSGIAYHTQVENDFLRFDLSNIPTIDKDRFYAIAPRICKTLPRGYKFNEEAICVDTIIEHETNNSTIWPNGKIGPKLIVSLYAKTQDSVDRPSKSFGLINRSTHYL
jgi:hypothetical protein